MKTMNASKRRRRKRRWCRKAPSPIAKYSREKLLHSAYLSLCCLIILIAIGDGRLIQGEAATQPTLGPAHVSLFSKMAASITSTSSQHQTQSQATPKTPILVKVSPSMYNNINNNNNNNIKSARMATHYSLSCPPEASIHPCTCLYHTPGAFVEFDGEEEEIFEISPTLTTPYAELLVMTSTGSALSSSVSGATSAGAATTTTPMPPPTAASSIAASTPTTSTSTSTTTTTTTTTTPVPPTQDTATTPAGPSSSSTLAEVASSTSYWSIGSSSQTSSTELTTNAPTLDRTTPTSPTSVSVWPSTPATEAPSTANLDARLGVLTVSTTPEPPSSTSASFTNVFNQLDSSQLNILSHLANRDPIVQSTTATSNTVRPAPTLSQIIDLISLNIGNSTPSSQTPPDTSTTTTTTTTSTTTPAPTSPPLATSTLTSNESDEFSQQASTSRSWDNGNSNNLTSSTTESTRTTSASTLTPTTASPASTQLGIESSSAGQSKPAEESQALPTRSPEMQSGATVEPADVASISKSSHGSNSTDATHELASNTTDSSRLEPALNHTSDQASASYVDGAAQLATLANISSAQLSTTPKSSGMKANDATEESVFVYSFSSSSSATTTSKPATSARPLVVKDPSPAAEQQALAGSSAASPTITIGAEASSRSDHQSDAAISAEKLVMSTSTGSTLLTTVKPPPTMDAETSTSPISMTTTTNTTATTSTTSAPTAAMVSNKVSDFEGSTSGLSDFEAHSSTMRPTAASTTTTTTFRPSTSSLKPLEVGADARGLDSSSRERERASGRVQNGLISTFSMPLSTHQHHNRPVNVAAATSARTGPNPNLNNNPGSNFSSQASAASPLSSAISTHTGASHTSHNRMSPSGQQNSRSNSTSMKPIVSTNGSRHRFSNHSSLHHSAHHSGHRSESSGRAIHSRHTSTTSTVSPFAAPSNHASPANLSAPSNQSSASHTSSPRLQTGDHQSLNSGSNGSFVSQLLTPNTHRPRSQPSGASRSGLANANSSRASASASASAAAAAASESVRVAPETPSPSSRTADDDTGADSSSGNIRAQGARRLTRRFLAQDSDASGAGEQPKVEILAYCKNIQNQQVLRDAIRGFRGHQVNYFVIDSCKIPAFPNDMFDSIDVKWLEISNSTIQFHNNYLRQRNFMLT